MTAVLFIAFTFLLIIGVPVAFSLGASGLAAILLGSDLNLSICAQRMYSGTASFSLLAIPFFVLAGNLMSAGGVSRRLINLCNSLIGHVTGGLSMVAIATCAFFAAISGSSIATAAAVGGIIIPEMLKQRYDRDFAAATVASSAELGVIIPPSIGLIMYCVSTGESVSTIFIAGFVPGIMIALTLMVTSHLISKKQGFVPNPKATRRERLHALRDSIWALLMPVLILGSIYTGICTPTEAAVISVVYALVVGMFVYREIKLSNLKEILLSSVMTTASVMLIVSASNLFGWIMTREQLPQTAANLFLSISDSKYVFLLLVNLLLLLVGLFCDAGAAIAILAPILAPVASALGIDLIHFGIIMMVNLAVGMMTPPVGVNLYVVCDTANVKIESMMKYLLIYFAVLVADILLITYIPAISLTLPALMN